MGNNSNGAVFRVHKNKNYTVMSNNHLLNRSLSLRAKGLMSLILALPDGWNYSIGGLTTLSNDGRDGVSSTLKTLQKFGYVAIEKTRESGQFKSIYHIFENPEENKLTMTENPLRSNHCGCADSENPQQQITNLQNTNNQDTNKESLVNSTSEFTPEDLYNLYKEKCSLFSQPRELTSERKKKAITRLKKRPNRDFWETVFKNANDSNFCKQNKFFCFDWILKNDSNPLKVFEGNYSNDKISKSSNKIVNFVPSNSSKYANYHEKQNSEGC